MQSDWLYAECVCVVVWVIRISSPCKFAVKIRISPWGLIPCLPLLGGGLFEVGGGLIQGGGGLICGHFCQICCAKLACFITYLLFFDKNHYNQSPKQSLLNIIYGLLKKLAGVGAYLRGGLIIQHFVQGGGLFEGGA